MTRVIKRFYLSPTTLHLPGDSWALNESEPIYISNSRPPSMYHVLTYVGSIMPNMKILAFAEIVGRNEYNKCLFDGLVYNRVYEAFCSVVSRLECVACSFRKPFSILSPYTLHKYGESFYKEFLRRVQECGFASRSHPERFPEGLFYIERDTGFSLLQFEHISLALFRWGWPLMGKPIFFLHTRSALLSPLPVSFFGTSSFFPHCVPEI